VFYVLISEIEDLPNSVKKQLFDELLDANAQKGGTFAPCSRYIPVVLNLKSIEFIARTKLVVGFRLILVF